MILYIILSYIIMLFTVPFLDGLSGFKDGFKFWLFSPLTLPLTIIVKFIDW